MASIIAACDENQSRNMGSFAVFLQRVRFKRRGDAELRVACLASQFVSGGYLEPDLCCKQGLLRFADGKTHIIGTLPASCRIEVTSVLALGSTSNFNIPVILAQQQVQSDRARVAQTSAQLRRDQTQLDTNLQRLAVVQQQVERAAQVEGAQAQRAGLYKLEEKAAVTQPKSVPVPQPEPQAQVNTNGQIVGQVINVVA